jgi:hypothetical protein
MNTALSSDIESLIRNTVGRLPAARRNQAIEIGTKAKASPALESCFHSTRVVEAAALAGFPPAEVDFILAAHAFDAMTGLAPAVLCFRESARLLREGGILYARLNHLPDSPTRFSAGELSEMARDLDFQVLSMEGAGSKSLWILWRKRLPGWRSDLPDQAPLASVHIRRISNAWDNEPVVPSHGRYAAMSIWVDGLPGDMDLLDLEILAGGVRATGTSISEPGSRGWQQVQALLPNLEQTGLVPVELRWFGERLTAEPAHLRVIPPGPIVPRVVNVSAASSRVAGFTVLIEELARPDECNATIHGQILWASETGCADVASQSYELRFQLPDEIPAGVYEVQMTAGRRKLPPVTIEVK